MIPKKYYMDSRTYNCLEERRKQIQKVDGKRVSQTQFAKRYLYPKLIRANPLGNNKK